MSKTKLLYLTDSYLKTTSAKVIDISTQGKQTSIILNQTIFYPQGGGQPADQGAITGKTGSLQVTHVSYNHGQPLHQGKLTGDLKKGDPVDLNLDWDLRYRHMQIHTAGHILHEAVTKLIPECKSVEGTHGIGKKSFVKFKGIIDQTQLQNLEDLCNHIIDQNEPITTEFMTKNQILKQKIFIPLKLPTNKPLRIMQIGDRPPMPDGGTHLKSTADCSPINLTHIEYNNGHSIIHYKIVSVPSVSSVSSVLPKSHPKLDSLSPQSFQSQLDQLRSQLDTDCKKLTLPKLQTKYLAKKGQINNLTKLIPRLPQKSRGQAGQLLNQLKN